MAIIAVKFGKSIEGESTVSGYEGYVEAVGLRETLRRTKPAADPNSRPGWAREARPGRVADIELVRFKDAASPKLAQACAAAENLGDTTVSLLRETEQGPQVYMQYTLTDTYVSRIEQLTVDAANTAYRPELLESGSIAPSGYANTGREIERVRLNVNQVTWEYTVPDNGGTVAKSFNLRTGTSS